MSRAAIQLLRKEGITETNLDLIFTPALQDYDFTIKVKANNVTTSSGILPPNTFKNLIQPLTSFPDDITTKYDLVQGYVDELNKNLVMLLYFQVKSSQVYARTMKTSLVVFLFLPT